MTCLNCNREIQPDKEILVEKGEALCPECFTYLQDLQNEETTMIEITREMAMDAGDPTLEGHTIRW